MKTFLKETLALIIICCSFLIFQSCKKEKKQTNNITETKKEVIKKKKVIEIITESMDFQMSDTIPSGWNTFRYINKSPQTHFFLIDKYPEGKNSEDAKKYVAPVFDEAMKLINEGKAKEGFAEFANLPEWFSEVVF